MKTVYSGFNYDPTEDMQRMIYDVERSPFSLTIEYFIMDPYTFALLREIYVNGVNSKVDVKSSVATFLGIRIAVVATVGNIQEKFVTIVHGYGELEK